MTFIWTETGHPSREALRKEMELLVSYMRDHYEAMSAREQVFTGNMLDRLAEDDDWVPSAKQLFWARDLHQKY